MRKAIIILSLYIIPCILLSQTSSISRCQSTEAMNIHFQKHPELKLQFDNYQTSVNNSIINSKLTTTTNYTIPVVFHILHLNGSENISDAQVEDAVNNLNIDFSKKCRHH